MDLPALTLPRKPKIFSRANRIKVFSPAKINLYLNVIGKYSDGFHKIESIVNRISIFDEITIVKDSQKDIRIFSNNKKLQGSGNLCVKAASLLQQRLNLNYGFSIFLHKNIPIGSGLGGASSNAAHTLLAIDKLLDLRLSLKELLDMGKKLGSDVNFFLYQVPWGYLSGRGDRVLPLNLKAKYRYLIVYPNIMLSTALVYGRLKAKLTSFMNNANILIYALRKQDLPLVERVSFNCLESSALSVCKRLKNVRQFFRKGGFFCLLTGSGSSFFTILNNYKNKKQSTGIALKRKMRAKGWLVFDVQTC
jgi:4-diphosphocytidyl-2-C-methyl-D-erythritol kinase